MNLSRRLGGPLSLVLMWCLPTASAAAWTEAAVRSAHVSIDLAESGEARVEWELEVRVLGGWLEEVDIAGLDPSVELASEPAPWAVDASGRAYAPRVEPASPGRYRVRFPGRSPRRGSLRIGLTFKRQRLAAAPAAGAMQRIVWTFPSWRSGLDGVLISVVAPPGSRPLRSAPTPGVRVSVERGPDGRVRLAWYRVHLPRTLEWPVRFEVPVRAANTAPSHPARSEAARSDAAAASARSQPGPAPTEAPEARLTTPRPQKRLRSPAHFDAYLWLGCAVALLSALKRVALRRRRFRALLPGPDGIRFSVMFALTLAFTLCGADRWQLGFVCLAAVVLLAAPGPRPMLCSIDPGAGWEMADVPALLRAGRWSHTDALDITRAAGALHGLGWLILPMGLWTFEVVPSTDLDLYLLLPLLAAPLFCFGARRFEAPEQLARLLRWAQRRRTFPPGVALLPMALRRPSTSTPLGVRLACTLQRWPAGLARLDLVVVRRPDSFGVRYIWTVVTRAESPAESALATALSHVGAESTGSEAVRYLEERPHRREDALGAIVAALSPLPAALLDANPSGHKQHHEEQERAGRHPTTSQRQPFGPGGRVVA